MIASAFVSGFVVFVVVVYSFVRLVLDLLDLYCFVLFCFVFGGLFFWFVCSSWFVLVVFFLLWCGVVCCVLFVLFLVFCVRFCLGSFFLCVCVFCLLDC